MANGDGSKDTVSAEVMKSASKKTGAGGEGASASVTSETNQEGRNKSPAPRSAPMAIRIISDTDKSVEPVGREGPLNPRMGGTTTSSSVDKLMRPHKTVKKGNTHTKPFMTCELWKACELATGQAFSPKRGDFSDINEYNKCCREWRARESQYLSRDRSSDIQMFSRNSKEGEPRRNLESHLLAATNRQTPQTPSLQLDGNVESKLTGASRSMRSPSPPDGNSKGNEPAKRQQQKSTEEGECDGPEREKIDEDVNSAGP